MYIFFVLVCDFFFKFSCFKTNLSVEAYHRKIVKIALIVWISQWYLVFQQSLIQNARWEEFNQYDYIFRLFPYWSKDWQWLKINFESVLTTSKDWHFRSAPPTDCSSSKTWSSMVLFYLFSLQKETLISSAWMNNLLEKNIKDGQLWSENQFFFTCWQH